MEINFSEELTKLKKKKTNPEFKVWSDSDHSIIRIATMREDLNFLKDIAEFDSSLLTAFNHLALIIAHYHGKEKSKHFLMSYCFSRALTDEEILKIQNETAKEVSDLFS